MDKIYSMTLHEVIHFKHIEIVRVPGGWTYTRFAKNEHGGFETSSCFVPFNNEFIQDDGDAQS
jgi:hypothetical protein